MIPERRDIAVTGIGIVSPVGTGVDAPWRALLAGRSGIAPITRFDAGQLPVKIAGEVEGFDPSDHLGRAERKHSDPFIQYGLSAARIAMEDAALERSPVPAHRSAVVVGVGMGGLFTIEETARRFYQEGRRPSPYFVPMILPNMAAGNIAISFGMKGPCLSPASACASGANAIGEALELLRRGAADFALAGGTEAMVTPLAIAGFSTMGALSTFQGDPAGASRPFDGARDGFVLAEGAAILVLERLKQARERGARVYAVLRGYATNDDAHHITSPEPAAIGITRCMQGALEDSGVCSADRVDYINAHGTATRYNDYLEVEAIKRVFGERAVTGKLPVSSTKSVTGHLMGAAGALEAALVALSVHGDLIPPTINFRSVHPPGTAERDGGRASGDGGTAAGGAGHPGDRGLIRSTTCDPRLDYVSEGARSTRVRVALSNSIGFGGANTSLVFAKDGLPEPGE